MLLKPGCGRTYGHDLILGSPVGYAESPASLLGVFHVGESLASSAPRLLATESHTLPCLPGARPPLGHLLPPAAPLACLRLPLPCRPV